MINVDLTPKPERISVRIDASKVRSEFHSGLVRELRTIAAASPVSRQGARRGREILNKLMRYGILVPDVPSTTAEDILPDPPLHLEIADHG